MLYIVAVHKQSMATLLNVPDGESGLPLLTFDSQTQWGLSILVNDVMSLGTKSTQQSHASQMAGYCSQMQWGSAHCALSEQGIEIAQLLQVHSSLTNP